MLSIILCLMIIAYLSYFAYKKRRLAQFTWVSLIMMAVIFAMCASNLLSFSYSALDDCFLRFRILNTSAFLMTKIMGLLLAFRYYQTIIEIYKFSLEGILPSEVQKKKRTFQLTMLVLSMLVVAFLYILLMGYFSKKHEYHKLLVLMII